MVPPAPRSRWHPTHLFTGHTFSWGLRAQLDCSADTNQAYPGGGGGYGVGIQFWYPGNCSFALHSKLLNVYHFWGQKAEIAHEIESYFLDTGNPNRARTKTAAKISGHTLGPSWAKDGVQRKMLVNLPDKMLLRHLDGCSPEKFAAQTRWHLGEHSSILLKQPQELLRKTRLQHD